MVLGPAAEFVVETPAEAEIDVPVGWQTSPRLAKTKRTSGASKRAGASGEHTGPAYGTSEARDVRLAVSLFSKA